MEHTNSPLSTYRKISPNKTSPRNHTIDTLTIHCFVGQVTAERGCEIFQNKSRQASCNYVVGHDGSIGICVEEKDRSWCSSNKANDHRAITFEVASDTKHPYTVTDKALNALIDLIVDVCKRNGKKKVLWFGDKSKTLAYNPKPDEMVMTVHRWFASKACPGDYLYRKHECIADQVNKRLFGSQEEKTMIMGKSIATKEQMKAYIKKKNPQVAQSVLDMIPLYLLEGEMESVRGDIAFAQSCLETGNFAFKGSAVTLDQNNFAGMGVTSNGMKGNSWSTPQLGIRAQIQHLKAYASENLLKNECIDPRFKYVTRGCAEYVEWLGIQENPQKKGWAVGKGYGEKIINILSDILNIKVENGNISAIPTEPQKYPQIPFKVKVIVDDLNYRSAPSMSEDILGVTKKGIFTIVETKNGWGKLKSSAGWIYLENPEYYTILNQY